MQADVVLTEMDTHYHAYIGTAIEMRKAWEHSIPVIVWGLRNRESKFLQYHATAIFNTLDEAIEHIAKMTDKDFDGEQVMQE
jgi:hypothetical protein